MSDKLCNVAGCVERHNHPSGYCYIHIETAERITAAPSGKAMTKVAVDGFNANADKRLVWSPSTFRAYRGASK